MLDVFNGIDYYKEIEIEYFRSEMGLLSLTFSHPSSSHSVSRVFDVLKEKPPTEEQIDKFKKILIIKILTDKTDDFNLEMDKLGDGCHRTLYKMTHINSSRKSEMAIFRDDAIIGESMRSILIKKLIEEEESEREQIS